MEKCCYNFDVSIDRILDKYDECISKNDTKSALNHLKYWENELSIDKSLTSKRNLLTVLNELIGLYRQINIKEDGYMTVNKMLDLIKDLNLENTISLSTFYTNIATFYKAFEDTKNAIKYYEYALAIYKNNNFDKNTYQYASLLNNYSLALIDINSFDRAISYFNEAIDILKELKNKDLEIAMTYLNIATLLEKEKGAIDAEIEIMALLDKAKDIFEKYKERDSYYAFVISKAESVYGYFGYFLYAKELKERSKDIYERARTS